MQETYRNKLLYTYSLFWLDFCFTLLKLRGTYLRNYKQLPVQLSLLIYSWIFIMNRASHWAETRRNISSIYT